jgi:hypothetical protein
MLWTCGIIHLISPLVMEKNLIKKIHISPGHCTVIWVTLAFQLTLHHLVLIFTTLGRYQVYNTTCIFSLNFQIKILSLQCRWPPFLIFLFGRAYYREFFFRKSKKSNFLLFVIKWSKCFLKRENKKLGGSPSK